jgi:hypothetical protein
MAGFDCCGGGDKAGELLDNWLECLEPPAEARMVNKIWIKSGHTLKDLVDVSTFPPKVNEGLYAEIMKLYPKDGILFNDGTGSGPDMTREEWIAATGADPLAQLAWQRRTKK